MPKRVALAIWIALLSDQAGAQSAVSNLRSSFVNCVRKAFIQTGQFNGDGNLPAAIERSFADCRTEEDAYFSTLAVGLSSAGPPNEGMLMARSLVDQLKAKLKADLMAAPPKAR